MQKGYTLSELIVVMAIALILLAASVPLVNFLSDKIDTFDSMDAVIRRARASAMKSGGYAALIIGDGNSVILTEGKPLKSTITFTTPQGPRNHRIPESYNQAVILYNSQGKVISGKTVDIDGILYKTTNRLIKDKETKYIHRSFGGLIN